MPFLTITFQTAAFVAVYVIYLAHILSPERRYNNRLGRKSKGFKLNFLKPAGFLNRKMA